jgi:PBP1b-binding outer membrane lipoprotein LpoB
MIRYLILAFALLLSGCSSTTGQGSNQAQANEASEASELPYSLENTLMPYLTKTLAQNPKFKSEPVLIVAMSNEQISTDIDDLTADIREIIINGSIVFPQHSGGSPPVGLSKYTSALADRP